MPEYFFHIALELFPEPNNLHTANSNTPLNLSYAFNALRPFLRSPRPHSGRDHTFDHKKLSEQTQRAALVRTNSSNLASLLPSWPDDHRLDHIQLACADMDPSLNSADRKISSENHIGKGIGTAISGAQTKGRYTPVVQGAAGEEWGIVHLYRDIVETTGLYKDSSGLKSKAWNGSSGVPKPLLLQPNPPPKDEDCTTLCILAVPSYLTPADFLAFVGSETRDQVSHFRMIRTARANRYMVLMKFHSGRRARDWQHEWNGKVFNSMEPETCHVVFLKSVEIRQPTQDATLSAYDNTGTFPKMSNDPFANPAPSTKPLAPRTASLVELPTCPVCLERMDETTGLLTILCQHVFHCTCLQKWTGGGCPVCRYTHDDFSSRVGSQKHKSKTLGSEYEVSDEALECETCHADVNLWQCLICGRVGCGRYEGKHAYKHFEETRHTFSMDLESKRVWDYASDVYVHRIIQDAVKPGEKLIELPGRRRDGISTALEVDEDVEAMKMDNVALEYTHLLTSQLESQRVYFEQIVERAVDKASQAAKDAEKASEECQAMRSQFQKLEFERDELLHRQLPDIESERSRLEKRCAKYEEMAKTINTRYLEEKSLASSLMERVKHLTETELVRSENRIRDLEEAQASNEFIIEMLRDENRDAMMQLNAQAALREMVARGEIAEEDLIGATIEAGPAAKAKKKKNKIGQPGSNISTELSKNKNDNSDIAVDTLIDSDNAKIDEDEEEDTNLDNQAGAATKPKKRKGKGKAKKK